MAAKVFDQCTKQVLDIQVFDQILEMDEDPVQREFSTEIVFSFFEETQKVLASMEEEVRTDQGIRSDSGLGKGQRKWEKNSLLWVQKDRGWSVS
ncbi:unnamed protein product [Clonostachys solani]|uniref:Uncharacterized protein n=1 Tax=Clonostachys solani TaxID=160281 RepID=A0A9N9W4N7_9HYPO|nr:unnamed protein product [Clonostachys solani]